MTHRNICGYNLFHVFLEGTVKQLLIILFCMVICGESMSAFEPKEPKDSIRIEQSAWNNSYYIDGKEYSRGEIIDILDNNPFTRGMMWSSSSSTTWGYVTLSAGLILTSGVMYNIWETQNDYAMTPTSSGFLLRAGLAVLFDILGPSEIASSNTKFKKAIQQYNQHLSDFSDNKSVQWDVHLGFNSIGVSLHF